jgi:predicted DNA-binding protein with PD1-like motif
MDLPDNVMYTPGRLLFRQLPPAEALLDAVVAVCRHRAISVGTFSLTGVLSCVTMGAFDQAQQVYVTHTETGSLEIVSCTGTIQFQNGEPSLSGTVLVSDITGKISGGRLFAPTHGEAVHLVLQELIAQEAPPGDLSKQEADYRRHPRKPQPTGRNL